MTKANPGHPSNRSILGIALLLLLAVVGAHLRLTRCAGNCGQHASPSAAACCAKAEAATTTGPGACCGCCKHAPAHLDETGDRHGAAVRHDEDRNPNGTLTGTCRRGCCLTLTFEGVEFAPAPQAVELPTPTAIVFAPLRSSWPTPDCRPLARGRPFDRGPPRTDRRTALRACTVLLI